jgi:hypothetical protein
MHKILFKIALFFFATIILGTLKAPSSAPPEEALICKMCGQLPAHPVTYDPAKGNNSQAFCAVCTALLLKHILSINPFALATIVHTSCMAIVSGLDELQELNAAAKSSPAFDPTEKFWVLHLSPTELIKAIEDQELLETVRAAFKALFLTNSTAPFPTEAVASLAAQHGIRLLVGIEPPGSLALSHLLAARSTMHIPDQPKSLLMGFPCAVVITPSFVVVPADSTQYNAAFAVTVEYNEQSAPEAQRSPTCSSGDSVPNSRVEDLNYYCETFCTNTFPVPKIIARGDSLIRRSQRAVVAPRRIKAAAT